MFVIAINRILITMKLLELYLQEKLIRKKRRNSITMKDNYTKEDFARGIIKNYSNEISAKDKIIMTIKAFLVAGQIENKEELRREVDAILE